MSRTSEVIKSKNKIANARKIRQKNEVMALKARTAFKARLNEQLKKIDAILDDNSIKEITVEVRDRNLTMFNECIYNGELASYVIQQSDKASNLFSIKKRVVSL